MLQEWAEKWDRYCRQADDGTLFVPGGEGTIYQHDRKRFALFISPKDKPRTWGRRRDSGVKIGMQVAQDGDEEGILLFDPNDEKQSQTAIKFIRARKKRRLSKEHRQKLIEAGKEHRFSE